MRYLIKFTKESDIKFISHLDLMRTIQRTMRRSSLPIAFSKGFNPHVIMSIAQPLSVGVYSTGEYMDMELLDDVECMEVVEKLNSSTPTGIKFLDAKKIIDVPNAKKFPPAMSLIDMAHYKIKIQYENTEKLHEEIKKILNEEKLETVKRSKKGEKTVDIKPMIKKFTFDVKKDGLSLDVLLACGSKENLSPDLLASFIMDNTSFALKDSFVEIMRVDLRAYKNKKLVPLTDLLK